MSAQSWDISSSARTRASGLAPANSRRLRARRSASVGNEITGLTTILALQTFAIVAGVTRLIPLTGVPLPLVSYGGSSRVATFVMLALLIRVSSGPMERAGG